LGIHKILFELHEILQQLFKSITACVYVDLNQFCYSAAKQIE